MNFARSIIPLFSLLGIFSAPSAVKAWDFYDVVYSGDSSLGNHVYGVNSETGDRTLLTTKLFDGNSYQAGTSYVDGRNRLVIQSGTGSSVHIYNPKTNLWSDVTSFQGSVFGANLISEDSDGTLSVGPNSLKLLESGGREKMWATNASGESIDIDIVNGSRLLINGRDVEKSIDNVGALSAALGSVPATSADSQFTCGFGAGTHSSAYALSGGCASRVSDRVSVNAALATVINNHTGDSDDNLSARAGFTFRLGKIDDSPKIAARKAAELHDKVGKLEESNQALAATNQSLMKLLQAQSARLDNLEKIASGQLSLLGDRASSD